MSPKLVSAPHFAIEALGWAIVAVIAILAGLALPGCQKMNTGGRLYPYQDTAFFPNGTMARLPVDGTVPANTPRTDEAFRHGTKDGVVVQRIPIPITMKLLRRGQERFNIFCAPCHSVAGDGQGMIVQRGFLTPPSYHNDRLRNAPSGHFFDVITHGYGAMYSYADRVPIADRWAIVAYIRALQKSQHARYDELPPDLRKRVPKDGTEDGDEGP